MILVLDAETYSAADLLRVGASAYAEDPSTGVHCAVFGWLDEETQQLDCWGWTPGLDLPAGVVRHVESGGKLLAHNCAFESALIQNGLIPIGPVKAHQWFDTMVLGCAASLPASLEALCEALGTEAQKDMEGHALMKRVCKVGADGLPPTMTSTEAQALMAYCLGDVKATAQAYLRLPKLTLEEQVVAAVDRRINERGVFVDLELCRHIVSIAKARDRALHRGAFEATGDLLTTAASPIASWMKEQGIVLPKQKRKRADGTVTHTESLDRGSIAKILEREDLPTDVRTVLEARVEAGRVTSLAKVSRAGEMVCRDGRLKNLLRYHGAHTGRWSSYDFQLHNLPKSKLKDKAGEVLAAIEAEDLDALLVAWPNPLEALSYSLRSIVAAPPGKELIGADFSAIEARVVAWLAGQQDVVDFFTAFDAAKARGEKPRDIYEDDAAKAGSDERQLGKAARLGLGYGMGPVRFIESAAGYGVELTPKLARSVVQQWRTANSNITEFWYALESAVYESVGGLQPTRKVGFLTVRGTSNAVYIQLPSGRSLTYWRPKLVEATRRVDVVDEDGTIKTREFTLTEMRFFRAKGGGMVQDSAYGGKLTENVTQAVARDLLAAGLVRLELLSTNVYTPVVHVHDAAAAEVTEGSGSVEEFCSVMTRPTPWSTGLPVAAEGYRSRRFKG